MSDPIKRIHIKTLYCDMDLDLFAFNYTQGNRVALETWTPGNVETLEPPEPYHTCTVNIPDEPLPEGHVFLKGWSGNEGLPEALAEAGVVELTGRRVVSGHVEAQEAKLLIEIPVPEEVPSED